MFSKTKKNLVRKVLLFYIFVNHYLAHLKQISSTTCNLLQCIVLVEVSEENSRLYTDMGLEKETEACESLVQGFQERHVSSFYIWRIVVLNLIV